MHWIAWSSISVILLEFFGISQSSLVVVLLEFFGISWISLAIVLLEFFGNLSPLTRYCSLGVLWGFEFSRSLLFSWSSLEIQVLSLMFSWSSLLLLFSWSSIEFFLVLFFGIGVELHFSLVGGPSSVKVLWMYIVLL